MARSLGIDELADRLFDLERRVGNSDRAARLQFATVGIATSDDDTTDAPVIDLDVSGALFTGVEASADAMTALDKVALSVRTYNQPTPPLPGDQPDGTIPPGSTWTDTDDGNRAYRWEGTPTAGAWTPQPLGGGALDSQLYALVTRNFDTIAERDAAFPQPYEGLQVYVFETNLSYQYAAGQWVPQLTFIRKGVDQGASSTTYVADNQLHVTLVPGWYRIEALLHLRGDPDGDVKISWSFSGTVLTGDSRHCLGPATNADTGFASEMRSTGNNYTSNIRYGVADASSDVAIREDLLFQVATVGELVMWFAQYAGAAGSAVVGEQSRMFITKVR